MPVAFDLVVTSQVFRMRNGLQSNATSCSSRTWSINKTQNILAHAEDSFGNGFRNAIFPLLAMEVFGSKITS